MKMFRRALAVTTAAAALTVALSPAASAQNVWYEIDNMNCIELEFGLKQSGLVGKDTTRSELVAILRLADPSGVLADRVAKRASDCGIVKNDSNLSSKLSSGLFSS